MPNSVTITLSAPLGTFKKWEIIRVNSSEDRGAYVIGVKKTENSITLRMFPNEKQDNKLTQLVWFYTLKLLVFLRII